MLVAFSGFLRTMEGLSIRQWQLVLEEPRGNSTIQLPDSKSSTRMGRVEVLLFQDSFCVRAAVKQRSLLPPDGPDLQRSIPAYQAISTALWNTSTCAPTSFNRVAQR